MAASAAVLFTTKTPYALPSQKFMIPLDWKRYQLSQLINKALSLAKPIPFDFLIRGVILRTTLEECRAEHGISEEDTLEIEYFESVLPPQRVATLPHESWVSSISCRMPRHFLTASYDGHIRLFNYAQQLVQDVPAHQAPVTSVCVVPSPASTDESMIIATASHDLTASLTRVSLAPNTSPSFQNLASLHLHTAPLSSISSDHTGAHLLTASWDHLVGLWDTQIPAQDEVESTSAPASERKKRRKVVSEADKEHGKRKAPTTVLKSHTARVSKAVFAPGSDARAYSCGFDSTVRTWDVESGVCMDTITVPERPMTDLAAMHNGHTILASSTDRTVSIFDLRSPSLASTAGTLLHPATPSCLVCPSAASTYSLDATANANESLSSSSTPSASQVLTGAYDGIARIWDLRSLKSAIASVKAWDGASPKKILSVDWVDEVVGVGGEGGVEIWRVGQGDRVMTK